MANDPAFLFYPNDYIGGTMGFTFEMHGMYILLLIYQFNNGAFDYESAQNICNNKFDLIKHKFEKADDKYFNRRLNDEMLKRSCHSKHQRINALKRWHCRINDNAMPLGNENGNENGNDNRNEIVLIPEEIKDTFLDFLAMRIKLKKPATNRAQKNIITELQRLAPDDYDCQNKILDQSITMSWQFVYALKENNQPKKKYTLPNEKTMEYIERREELKRARSVHRDGKGTESVGDVLKNMAGIT